MARKRLGELLVEEGIITKEQLDMVLDQQKIRTEPLGRILLDLKLVKEEALVRTLSKQLNIPVVLLDHLPIRPEVLTRVSAQFCKDHKLLPFRIEPVGNFLDVAMVEPVDLDTLDKLRVQTQCNVRSYFTTYGSLAWAMWRYHGIQMDWVQFLGRKQSGSLAAQQPDLPEPALPVFDQIESKAPSSLPVPGIDREDERTGRIDARLASVEEKTEAIQKQILECVRSMDRDERIIRSVLKLLIEKGVITTEELKELL